MSEIKHGGLEEYGAEPFEQLQIGTAGVEGDIGQFVLKSVFAKTKIPLGVWGHVPIIPGSIFR